VSSPVWNKVILEQTIVIPAQAGIQGDIPLLPWTPASAGVTSIVAALRALVYRLMRLDGALVGLSPFGKAAPAMMIMSTSAPATQ
jgi:hypothetical protein